MSLPARKYGFARLALCLTPALVVLGLCFRLEGTPGTDKPGPEGVWVTVGEGRSAFRYDGRHVTLCLLPRWTWEWLPWDLHWRLESEWRGDDLFVRGPYGGWCKEVSFAEGSFSDELGHRYRKVGFWEATWSHPELLRLRAPYDYSLNPSERGLLWPGWARGLWPIVQWGQDRLALLVAFLLAVVGGFAAARWWSRSGNMTGRTAGIVAINPPSEYSQSVWDELVRQGKLKRMGECVYGLVEE